MSPDDAMVDGYDVFMADDTTSFLSGRLVGDLQKRRIAVVGVYDPDEGEGSGKQRLLDMGVNDIIEADATPAEFLRVLGRVTSGSEGGPDDALVILAAESLSELPDPYEPGTLGLRDRGRLTVVAGASGGVGATETAIALSVVLRERGESTVLVDADDIGPSVAQRLGLSIYPNIRTAIDSIRHGSGDITDTLLDVPSAGFQVLGGLANRRDWFELRPSDVSETLLELAAEREHVVVNVGARTEDLPAMGGPARYGVTRSVLSLADVVVLVAAPSPVGAARVLDWIAETRPLIEATPLYVAFNSFNGGRFMAAELDEELREVYRPRSVLVLPQDKALANAAWQGTVTPRGPFLKAVGNLANAALPSGHAQRRRRRHR